MFFFSKKPQDNTADLQVQYKQLEAKISQLGDQISIISEINNSILATRSLDEVLQTSIDSIVEKLELLGAVLLLKQEDFLYAKTIAGGRRAELFVNTIGIPISNLKIQLSASSENKVVQAVNNRQLIFDGNLSAFTKEVLPDIVVSQAGKLIGIRNNVCIPIVYNDEVIGAVVFASSSENFDAILPALQLLSKSMGISIINAQLFSDNEKQIKQLAIQNRELGALSELSKSIISTLETNTILQKTVDLIPQDLGYIAVIVALLNAEKTELRVAAITNNPLISTVLPMLGKDKSELVVLMNDANFQNTSGVRSIKEDKIVITDDFIGSFSPPIPKVIIEGIQKVLSPRAFVNVPIKSKGETLGVIGFILKDKPAADVNEEMQRFMQSYTHAVGIALDNSRSFAEKERLLKELEQKVAELEEAARKEKDMLDILAHELRTPISIARNYFEMLSQGINPIPEKLDAEKFGKYVQTIRQNFKREIDLLETMLSSTIIDQQKLQLKTEEVPIAEVVLEVVSNYKQEAEAKSLQLINEAQDNTVAVKGDKVRVTEVLSNIFSNAIKYTKTGSIKISFANSDQFVGIRIEDTGEGIPAEDIPNLGKKFFRVNQHIDNNKDSFQTFTRPGGTGLGLYVAFGLVKLMGGNIQVISEIGKGSTFTVWLPK